MAQDLYPICAEGKATWKIGGQEFWFPLPRKNPARWVYSPALAQKWVDYFRNHTYHVKGLLRGEHVELMPWLEAGTRELFGWVDRETGYRRYLESFGFVARKNSKTLWNAGLATGMLTIDNEKGAECYILSGSERQAQICFEMVGDQVKLSEALGGEIHEVLSLRESLLRVDGPEGGFIEVLSGLPKNKTGFNPHFCLFDEYHEITDKKLITAMRTGAVQRKQPLTSYITTAGDDTTSPCYQEFLYALKIRNGEFEDHEFPDRYMQMMFFSEEEDDPHSPETWKKANPGLGISVNLDILENLHDKAWAMHSGDAGEIAQGGNDNEDEVDWNGFQQFHCNKWVTPSAGYVAQQAWKDCAFPGMSLEQFRGRSCFAGMDLSESVDMNAFALLFPTYTDELVSAEDGNHEVVVRATYDCLVWYWVCESAALASERTPFKYGNHITSGNLEITPGNTADQDLIESRIVAISKIVNILECGYDAFNAGGLSVRLKDKYKIPMLKVRQGFLSLNEPTKHVRRLILRHEFRHPDNSVLNWNVRNARVVKDINKNEMLSKQHAPGKIDGLAAVNNAMRCALDSPLPPPSASSHYGSGDWIL